MSQAQCAAPSGPTARFRVMAAFLCLSGLGVAGAAGAATLTVTVTDIGSDAGRLTISIYDEDTWLRDPIAEQSLVVAEHLADGRISTRFELDAGDYAIAVYQDENDNGELDANFFRIPREPYGFSRDQRPRFGPPRYRNSVFTLGEEGLDLEILLRD